MATYTFGSSSQLNSDGLVTHLRRSYSVSDIKTNVRNNIPKYSKINSVKFSFDAYQTIALSSTKSDGIIRIGANYNDDAHGIAGKTGNMSKDSWTTIATSDQPACVIMSGVTAGEISSSYASLSLHYLIRADLPRTMKLKNTFIYYDFTPPTYTISLSSNNTNYGTVSGGGTWNVTVANFTKTITATPKTGYKFVKWSDGNTNASRSITISQNNITSQNTTLSLTATFELDTITATFKNTDGSVVSTKALNIGAKLGTLPTVSRSGYTFAGWIPCAPAIKTDNSVLDSYQYNGSTAYPLNTKYKSYTDKLSVHIEAYASNWDDMASNDAQIISCTESGGWGIGEYAAGAEVYAGGYKGIDLGFSSLSDKNWHTFDIVFSNGTFEAYVDGTKKGTQTTNKTAISYNSDNTIFVGAESHKNASTPEGKYFNGYISNVFIANQGTKLEIATSNTIINNNITYYPIWRKNIGQINQILIANTPPQNIYIDKQVVKSIFVNTTKVYG